MGHFNKKTFYSQFFYFNDPTTFWIGNSENMYKYSSLLRVVQILLD